MYNIKLFIIHDTHNNTLTLQYIIDPDGDDDKDWVR